MKAFLRKVRNNISKVLPIWIICSLIIGGSWWLLRNHYFKSARNASDPVSRIESLWYDIKVTLIRGKEKPTGKVGLLAIDEDSIHEFGRFPFSRKYYEQAFRNLKNIGVKWIGFDVVYDQPERPGLDDV